MGLFDHVPNKLTDSPEEIAIQDKHEGSGIWYWPTCSTVESAEKAVKGAMHVSLFVAAATLVAWGLKWAEPLAWIDSIMFMGIAVGLHFKSRVMAIAGLILYFLEMAFNLSKSPHQMQNPVLAIIFSLALLHGIRGTFAYRRMLRSHPPEASGSNPEMKQTC